MSRQSDHAPRRRLWVSTVGGRPARMDFEATPDRTWGASTSFTSPFSAAC